MLKKITIIILCFTSASSINAQTWDKWFEQKKTQRKYLLQQIAKLQLYIIYVKKGYTIVDKGLDLVGQIKKGDLDLHNIFFNSLKTVNPKVRKYVKVADIIAMQIEIVSSYKKSYSHFQQSGVLTRENLDYLYNVFASLLDKLTDDITELTAVLKNNELELTDDERIKRIDVVYNSVLDKYEFFYSFSNKVRVMIEQKKRELNDNDILKKLYEP